MPKKLLPIIRVAIKISAIFLIFLLGFSVWTILQPNPTGEETSSSCQILDEYQITIPKIRVTSCFKYDNGIYVIGQSIDPKNQILSDKLLQVGFDGRVEREFAYSHFFKKMGYGKVHKNQQTGNEEITQLQSLSLLPENPVAEKIPGFAKGNFLLTDNFMKMILILDRRWKKLLWKKQLSPDQPNISRAEVLSSGKILLKFESSKEETPEPILYDPLKNSMEPYGK